MTVNAGKDVETEDPHSYWCNCKSGTATLEVRVADSQKAKNRSTKRPSYTIPGPVSTGLIILLLRYLLSHVPVF